VISIVIHPSVRPAQGRTSRSLSVKAFVVPPLSRQQVPGQDLARRTHAAHPQPRRQAMTIMR
jgi:hypothetical protein